MKKLIFSIFCALIGLQVTIAQVPNLMSYQAVIWDASGNLVSEKTVSIKISILQGSVSGTSVYSETHKIQTNINGLVSLAIGGGTNAIGKISDINWGSGSYFLKTETDPTGGGNFTITGTTQLVSVPYSLFAGNIQTQNSGLPGQVLKLDDLGKPFWAGESFPKVNTIAVNSISTTTAISGGNVSSDGGASITTRGVVWSTSTNPTVSLTTKTSNGTGTGTFSSSLTGLSPNTTYYVRAYATNSAGTGYGNEINFKTSTSLVLPIVSTISVSSITTNTATSGGNISSDGGSAVILRGVVWSTSPTPTISLSTKTSDGSGTGTFSSSLTGLSPNTAYYIRAYATNSAGTGYGNQVIFITNSTTVPSFTVTTSSISAITSTTATSGGNISSEGGAEITARGVEWSTNPNLIISSKTSNGSGTGTFSSSLTGLSPNTTYYVRAYATTSAGTGYSAVTGYGNQVIFTTSTSLVLPTVSTISASSITTTTATLGGNITSDGGSAVTARGVVWSTSSNPTISLTTKTSNSAGTGTFSSSLTGLSPNTAYYVRAYATNSAGTGYGNEVTFTTSNSSNAMNIPCPGIPTVKDIDGNTYNTVSIGTQCWIQSNLKVSKYKNGDAIPTGLNDGTWRSTTSGAYTIYNNDNANDAIYGKLYNWYAVADNRGLCPNGWHVPTDAEWTTLTNYLGGQSVAGGKMKSIGNTYWRSPNLGATNVSGFSGLPGGSRSRFGDGLFHDLQSYGYYWSATRVDDNKAWFTFLGWYDANVYTNNSMNFPSLQVGISIRCLKDSTITTNVVNPSINTTQLSAIMSNSATSGGNVSSDGGSAVTSRGVVWSTSSNPTISLTTKTSNGSGTGTFSSSLTGLTPNTTYYVRAYATNSVGTGYGNEVTFKTSTLLVLPTVSTVSASSITTNTATSGGNISSDGGSAVTARGVVWSTSSNPTISLTTKTSNGTGIGTFSSSLTGLTPNIVYYIRAYATNSAGTGYGNEVTFKSLASVISSCTVNGANGEILTFSCYNLGAVATSDPYTPRWELNGDYWQWGRKEKAANGPSNGTVGGGNHEVVTVWNRVGAPMGAWSDANKTANDPCPSGFRLPTAEQWESIASTNIKELYFTFSLSYTHYDNGWRIKKSFDDTGGIYLPNAGERNYYDGSLNLCRSCDGYYWSSSYDSVINHGIGFSNFSVGPQISTTGRSIRCIVE
jgi:uncharacterized protein (TIGR02145 family)